jgi:hypothetical protein
VVGLFALPVLPAVAVETVTCTDADGEVTFSYDIDPRLEQPILAVDMQLTDDYGFTTRPDRPDYDGEYVSEGAAGNDFEGGEVSWGDEDGSRRHAMSFRIGRAFEARQAVVGGVVAVAAGGVWVVSCTSTLYDE